MIKRIFSYVETYLLVLFIIGTFMEVVPVLVDRGHSQGFILAACLVLSVFLFLFGGLVYIIVQKYYEEEYMSQLSSLILESQNEKRELRNEIAKLKKAVARKK